MKRTMLIAMLVCAAQAAAAQTEGWYVIEYPDRHACQRTTALPASGGWVEHGPFNTFRQAGAWEWRNRALCKIMG